MLECTKAIVNNLNQLPYIKNINKVTLRESYDVEDNSRDSHKADYSMDRIEALSTGIRKNNLRIFMNSYWSARSKRFFLVSLPAILGAVTIGCFAVPSKRVVRDEVSVYNVEKVLINSELGQSVEEDKLYRLGFVDSIFSNELVDEDKLFWNGETDPSSSLTFRISDDLQSLSVDFGLNDGNLSVSTATASNYLDLTKYEDIVFNEIEDKYASLFDEIIKLLENSTRLSSGQRERLKNLNESEKKVIVIEIVNYTKVGSEEVDILKKKRFVRIMMAIIMGIYAWAEGSYISKNNIGERESLVSNDGVLEYGATKDMGLFYGPLRCKEAFLKAEEDRICALDREIKHNLDFGKSNDILSNYEKQLIKRVNNQ